MTPIGLRLALSLGPQSRIAADQTFQQGHHDALHKLRSAAPLAGSLAWRGAEVVGELHRHGVAGKFAGEMGIAANALALEGAVGRDRGANVVGESDGPGGAGEGVALDVEMHVVAGATRRLCLAGHVPCTVIGGGTPAVSESEGEKNGRGRDEGSAAYRRHGSSSPQLGPCSFFRYDSAVRVGSVKRNGDPVADTAAVLNDYLIDRFGISLERALADASAGVWTLALRNSHNSRTAAHSDAAVEALIYSGMRAVHASGAPQAGD